MIFLEKDMSLVELPSNVNELIAWLTKTVNKAPEKWRDKLTIDFLWDVHDSNIAIYYEADTMVTETIEITNDFKTGDLVKTLSALPPETVIRATIDSAYENIYLSYSRELTPEELAKNIEYENTLEQMRKKAQKEQRLKDYNDLKDSSIIQKWEELRKEFEE